MVITVILTAGTHCNFECTRNLPSSSGDGMISTTFVQQDCRRLL